MLSAETCLSIIMQYFATLVLALMILGHVKHKLSMNSKLKKKKKHNANMMMLSHSREPGMAMERTTAAYRTIRNMEKNALHGHNMRSITIPVKVLKTALIAVIPSIGRIATRMLSTFIIKNAQDPSQ